MQKKRDNVKILLLKYHLNYTWLINELEKLDVLVSKTELSDMFSGRKRGEKTITVINKASEILERYGKCYGDVCSTQNEQRN